MSTKTSSKKRTSATDKNQAELLVDVANLDDGSLAVFRRRWRRLASKSTDRELLELRDGLRRVWQPRGALAAKERIVERWLTRHVAGFDLLGPSPWRVSLATGRIYTRGDNVQSRLVLAVLAHYPMLKVCANERCSTPYFVARRRDSKCCETPECQDMQRRKWGRDYWNTKGAKAREARRSKRR